MIPRFKPSYSSAEWLAAFTPSRGNIPKYEKKFAKKFGCEYGVMFAHGRTGLYALLKVWGLQNSEVICPAYTCVVVPHAIVLSGNTPVFVDCESGHFNMSLDEIRAAVTENTRVIIPTHLFGYAMDIDAVQAIADEAERKYNHKVYVVQDCAHSYGALRNGKMVTQYGDAAIFGSNISKIINSIFGGMVITHDSDLASRLLRWREENSKNKGWVKSFRRMIYFISVNFAFNSAIYGFVNWMERKGLLNYFVKYYREDAIDFPSDWDYAPSELEARVGLVQLQKYDDIVSARRESARRVISKIKDLNDIKILPFDEGATYSHIVAIVEDREKWIEEYRRKGIQLGILIDYSIPSMKAYKRFRKNPAVHSDRYSNHVINFPVCLP